MLIGLVEMFHVEISVFTEIKHKGRVISVCNGKSLFGGICLTQNKRNQTERFVSTRPYFIFVDAVVENYGRLDKFDDIDNEATQLTEFIKNTMSETATDCGEDVEKQFEVRLLDEDHSGYLKSSEKHARGWIECSDTHVFKN